MLTSAWFQACAAVNAFHYNEVFYFLQLSLYVILKGTGIRLVYVLLQPLSQWQCFAISHFYGHTFKRFFVTLSLGFKDNELIFRSNDSKVSFLCTLHITAGDSVSLLFCALKESHACANHIQRQKRKKKSGISSWLNCMSWNMFSFFLSVVQNETPLRGDLCIHGHVCPETMKYHQTALTVSQPLLICSYWFPIS